MDDVKAPSELRGRLVAALIEAGCVLQGHDESQSRLTADGVRLFILDGPEALARLPHLGAVGDAEVLVLGGPPETKKRLKKARPWLTQGRIYFFHLGDDDVYWQGHYGAPGRLGALLERRHELPAVDAEAFERLREASTQRAEAEADEVRAFEQRQEKDTPWVTYCLAAALVLFFGLEVLWGGSASMPTVIHMGALVRQTPFAEPWRLLSCTFLHLGVEHFAFNTFVLISFGRYLERILGGRRFLVLYVVSALCGSLASVMALGEGFSVGASGAIWGMLGAMGVFATRPMGLIPAAVLPGLKRAALINLGLNFAYSFRPEVDWAAHLGGGVGGALLILSGGLTSGIPRLDAEPAAGRASPVWLLPASVLLTASLVAAAVTGIVVGQPWAIGAKAKLERRAFGSTDLFVEVPSAMTEQSQSEAEGAVTILYGDLAKDSRVIEVLALPFVPPLRDEERMAELEGLRAELGGAEPEGMTVVEAPTWNSGRGAHWNTSLYQLGNGLVVERAVILTADFIARVDVVTWPELQGGANRGLAERMAQTVSR